MFDLITGKADHIPARPLVPLVVSTTVQLLVGAALVVPLLIATGTMPEPPDIMAFVAPPPAPPPPPPPPPPPAPAKPTPPPERPVPAAAPAAAPIEPPRGIHPAPLDPGGEEGVPGGIEGGIFGGVPGGIVGGLPDMPLPPPPPPPPAPRGPVRVGGQIEPPTLIRRVEPVYPALAVRAHVEGVVILEALVDRDGRVESVTVLRSAGGLLDRAAIDAVRQWQYSPLILNGIPERFILTVVLSFNLDDAGG